jgi:hypothetical protein
MTPEESSSSPTDFGGAFSQAIRDNPLPAALIGGGLIWLLSAARFSGSDDPERPRREDSRALFGARQRLAGLMDRQPLALGAIGLGVGAAMASAIGVTKVESDLMGETSAKVQDKARKLAASAGDHAATTVDRVASAVADEARTQGFTPDAVKQSASELAERVGRIASESTERLKRQ